MKRTAFIGGIALTGILLLNNCMSPTEKPERKTAYAVTNQLYDGFDMKRELETKYVSIQQYRQAELDSLKISLNILVSRIETDQENQGLLQEYQVKYREFEMKENQYLEANQAMDKQYNEQILQQLNQYIKDYGRKHGYTYIYGTQGSSNLLYADDSEDITEELINYCNSQYKGG